MNFVSGNRAAERVEPAPGIVFDHATLGQRILFGTGRAAENVLTAVRSLGATRVLLIAGASSSSLAASITDTVPVVWRIRDVVQHVPADNAATAVSAAREARADLVVALGGGSAVGLAKIIARDTGLPIVAVPTTFAGSEATDVWGITENGRKSTGVDSRVLPRVVVYDAALSSTLPAQLVVASGMNAIAHAVDGFWAPRADPINIALGTEGLRALVPGLKALAVRSEETEARERTLYGSYLAAAAFASAGSGMHHKICHALGGSFNLPHAEMHSVVIGHVAAFNAASAPDAANRISSALGADSPGQGLFALGRELGTPRSLHELGFQEADIPAAAEIILPTIPVSNPRPVSKSDLEGLLRAAWEGTDPA
ncbi:maleylacetate reductase [Glaciibacter sp. 2TAF33]|uniref:maleylacetate reductase n=1 Tax=Glaciibacter sp. 2TAF33 TaxID=3233015 RepID=UPI003F93142E